MLKTSRLTISLIIALTMVGIAAVLWLLLNPVSPRENTVSEKIKVASTILPLHSICEAIGGDRVESISILPPGASPHTFELTPSDLSNLEDVENIFAIGQGLDDWVAEIGKTNEDVKIFTVDQGIDLLPWEEEPEEDVDHDHYHSKHNPHYWLSIENGEQIARNIATQLTATDPAGSQYYQTRLEEYIQQLSEAKVKIDDNLANLNNRQIVTFHNAWPYFAEEFGLEIVATFEAIPGQEPTPQYLSELGDTIADNDIRVIFSEPQLSTLTLEPFLQDFGVAVAVLDPLGKELGVNSYVEMMVTNSETIRDNLAK